MSEADDVLKEVEQIMAAVKLKMYRVRVEQPDDHIQTWEIQAMDEDHARELVEAKVAAIATQKAEEAHPLTDENGEAIDVTPEIEAARYGTAKEWKQTVISVTEFDPKTGVEKE